MGEGRRRGRGGQGEGEKNVREYKYLTTFPPSNSASNCFIRDLSISISAACLVAVRFKFVLVPDDLLKIFSPFGSLYKPTIYSKKQICCTC